ncbi:MAG: pentapeptide repeat-containing protein [Verrucomicrobia bacterium]|nr:pentapeptide repeat-containing protein [Verrucomicrobiota bacterium]
MSTRHTPESLPVAVSDLFRLNNFEVIGPTKIHGAEIDLVATSKSDPFSSPIYIEVTVEYVENDKYGKDATKALLILQKEPASRFLIISSEGFTLPVLERAKASRIETLTYDQLFSRFEKFDPYFRFILTEGELAKQLTTLEARYEEPNFSDSISDEQATPFLTSWKNNPKEERRWLVVVGEYGTGKTALTHILARRWLREYKENPSRPIPLRIELRDFTRQFNAQGLLHHFLDKHDLGHIPVDFLMSLIRRGRVVLILDGYDEMAQFLNVHERRACLEALSQFAADGGKGILTSRPNYFSEAEELRVMESLYRSVENFRYITKDYNETITAEKAIDSLLGAQFINRFERNLQDLTPTQTEALISRVLINAPHAKSVVLEILSHVFREMDVGEKRSLAGKPVIITYLLEITDELKSESASTPKKIISEWDVYTFIIEKLMFRDFRRTPEISPQKRLLFLQQLAILASKRDNRVLNEEKFIGVIKRVFHSDLRHRSDNKEEETQRLFEDLRSSATLTRANDGVRSGWAFSHNSLREFLCAQHLMDRFGDDTGSYDPIPITDAMKTFIGSKPPEEIRAALKCLTSKLRSGQRHIVGPLTCLLWDGISKLDGPDPIKVGLSEISERLDFSDIALDRISLSSSTKPLSAPGIHFANAVISDCSFEAADLTGASFAHATLQGVSFSSAKLNTVNFTGATLQDVDISHADLAKADVNELDINSTIIKDGKIYSGNNGIGLMVFLGATISQIAPIHVLQHHPSFEIAQKIARKLVEGGLRQERGLTQRGAARQDTDFARSFLTTLEALHFAESPRGRNDLIEITDSGRRVLGDLVEKRAIDPQIAKLFQ